MKKFILFLFIIPFLSVQAQEFNGSVFWEISGNGLEKNSYIMGTHHMASLSILDSMPLVMTKLNQSEQIIGEVVVSDMFDSGSLILQLITLPDGISYRNFLSEKEYNELDSLLINHLGAGLQQAFGQMKPAMVAVSYAISLFEKNSDQDMANHIPIDFHFQQVALAQDKDVIGLETAEDQMHAILDAVPYKRQAEDLLCVLRNTEYDIDLLDQLNKYYYSGNIEELAKIENDPSSPCPTSQESKDALNKNRNLKWMEVIPTLIHDKSSFIAVGCLHLAGEYGLLNQLYKLGYTITAVN